MKQLSIIFGFIFVVLLSAVVFQSCDFWENSFAKHYGGTMTVNVKPGYKVSEATWKDDELWYMTEPMDANDTPKDKEFVEHSQYGVLEGKVIFHETKK